LSNEPLLIIDGVRAQNSAIANPVGMGGQPMGVGGQTTSRLNDINPEDIESVEILKGPAAAALYGTAAANGVIQITTRRGRAGTPRWNVYTEGGVQWDPTEYPANYGWRGTTPSGSSINQCTLFQVSTGACTRTGDMLEFSPLDAMSPFRGSDNFLGVDRAGTRSKFGASVSGGSDAFTYFLSGDRDSEQGVYRNNELGRTSLRGNFTAQARDDLEFSVTSGWVQNLIAMPQNDNNLIGQVAGALLGRPVDDDALRGYAGARPDQVEQFSSEQSVRRFTGGLNATYRPTSWLSLVSQTGLDAVSMHDTQTVPKDAIFSNALIALGFRNSNRAEVMNLNAGAGATATYALTDALRGMTSVGVQFQREVFESSNAFGRDLLPGTERLPGTSTQFVVSEEYIDNRTIGAYVQQQLAFRDRVFVTGALRGDDNSAFGSDFGLITYPSVSASWVIAEEPWFPVQDAISSLRLRGAFGTSGLRPTFRDATTFFAPVSATVAATDVPAFTIGGVGDPTLKPEFTREFEVGLDLGFLDDRAGLEVSYYNKRSRDALVFRNLGPSVGASTGALGQGAAGRFENVGSVSNTGWELLARVQPVNRRQLRWNVQATASLNRNRLVRLGEDIEPILLGLGGASQQHKPGFPLGGYWGKRLIGWSDDNNDGVIQHTEVMLSDTAEFLGNPNPGREFALTSTATLFDVVRLNVLVDGKSDYVLNNSTRFFRCASAFVNCREAFDPTTPLEDQARAIAASGPAGSQGVYFEDASFVKLREVAVTFIAPQRWARLVRAGGLSLTIAGRNLHTWTDYTGFDPELNFAGGGNHVVADFNTQSQLRYFTTRINLDF
jgi:TonB-dependent starch-binding outer membrane protein SusC